MWLLDDVSNAVSSAYHTVADPVASTVSSAASTVAAGVNSATEYGSNLIHRAEGGITSGVRWAEDAIDSGTHSLAAHAAGVPILGSVAEAGADALSFAGQVAGGVVGGASTMVGGIANMALHPLATAYGIEQMAEHAGIPVLSNTLRAGHDLVNGRSLADTANRALNPFEDSTRVEDGRFWSAVGNGIIDPYRESIREGRYGEVVGRAGFDIGSLFIGAGEAGAAAHGVEGASVAARAAEGASVAAHAAEGASIAAHGAEGASVAARGAEAASVAAHGAEGASVAAHGAEGASVARGPRPVMEMPAVNPAEAMHPTPPVDWNAGSVGRPRGPGHVGEMPAVDPAAVARGEMPPGFNDRAGRVSTRSSAPVAPAAPAVNPHAPTMPSIPVDAHAPTMPSIPVDAHAPTLPSMPQHTPTLPGIGGPPPARSTLPGIGGPPPARSTLPGIGQPPSRSTLPGIGEPLRPPVDPHAPTLPSIPADPHAPTLPQIQSPSIPELGSGQVTGPLDPGRLPAPGGALNPQLNGVTEVLMGQGDHLAARDFLLGHGVPPSQAQELINAWAAAL